LARIGILGGTFDPPHNGHIAIAIAALNELELSKVIFIPAKNPPHKIASILAPAEHRINMLRLAIDGLPDFEVSDIELKREGLSFTADTLEELGALYPHDELVLIIGADNVSEMEGWHQPMRILSLATVAAANRPDFFPAGRLADRVINFWMPPTDISSTEIRNRIRAGLSISGLVTSRVENYILVNKLYLSNE